MDSKQKASIRISLILSISARRIRTGRPLALEHSPPPVLTIRVFLSRVAPSYVYPSPYLSAAAAGPGVVSLPPAPLSHAAAVAAAASQFYEYQNAAAAAAAAAAVSSYPGQYPAGFEGYPYTNAAAGKGGYIFISRVQCCLGLARACSKKTTRPDMEFGWNNYTINRKFSSSPRYVDRMASEAITFHILVLTHASMRNT